MKKLRLDAEQLSVESFEPATTQGEHGTVIGQQQAPLPTGPIACPEPPDTFAGPGCYRVTGDAACYEWTEAPTS